MAILIVRWFVFAVAAILSTWVLSVGWTSFREGIVAGLHGKDASYYPARYFVSGWAIGYIAGSTARGMWLRNDPEKEKAYFEPFNSDGATPDVETGTVVEAGAWERRFGESSHPPEPDGAGEAARDRRDLGDGAMATSDRDHQAAGSARRVGPRERWYRESAARTFPEDGGAAFLRDPFTQVSLERRQILDALDEALDGWADAAQYKGDYLQEKHGDAVDIEKLRAFLKECDGDDDV